MIDIGYPYCTRSGLMAAHAYANTLEELGLKSAAEAMRNIALDIERWVTAVEREQLRKMQLENDERVGKLVSREEVADAVAKMAAHDRDEALVNCNAAGAEATRLREALTSLVNAVEDAFESPWDAQSWARKGDMVGYMEKANAALAASRAGEI